MTLFQVPNAQSPRLSRASRCSIAELSPNIEDQTSKFIDGVISLIWPYSSSTRRIAILLADPDSRIRKAKGQTKVTFYGSSAIAVAESQVGIADTVHLSLEAAQWKQSGENTPEVGKQADWDLEYIGTVLMEVHRGTIPLAVIDVSHGPEHVDGPLREIAANGGHENPEKELWSSPAFAKQTKRLSDPFSDPRLRSFVDEDGYIPGRGRKRTKFSRDSGSWRYVDRGSSSDEENRAPAVVSEIEIPEDGIDASALPGQEGEVALVDIMGETASGHPGPHARHGHPSPAALEEPAGNLMPPPSISVTQQRADELSTKASAEGIQHVFELKTEHEQHQEIATPPRATTPRLLPMTSPGLPLISPLIKRHGAAIGYFPPVSDAQSELDSSAENGLRDWSVKVEKDAVSAPFDQSARSLRQGPKNIGVLQPATEIVDLTSPVEGDAEQYREEKSQDLRTKIPVGDRRAVSLEQFISTEPFEFFNYSPDERKPENRNIPVHLPYQVSKNSAEVEKVGSSVQLPIAADGSQEAVPSPSNQMEDLRAVAPEVTEEAAIVSTPYAPAVTLIDQPTVIPAPNLSTEIVAEGQVDVGQDGTSQASSSTTRRPSHWTENLEISAREVEYDGLTLSSPPFPFEQRWDTTARKEIKSRQALHAMQAGGFRVSRRHSYDGADDIAGSSDELSDTMADIDGGRKTLLRDHGSHLVQEEIGTGEEIGDLQGKTDLESNDAQVTELEGSHVAPAMIAPQCTQVVELNPGIIGTPFPEPKVEHGVVTGAKPAEDTDVQGLSKPSNNELYHNDDGVGRQSPPLEHEQEDAQQLPEMPLSQSPAYVPRSDVDTFMYSSTSKWRLLHDPQIKESESVLTHVENEEAGDEESPKASGRSFLRADQLATPDNTQQEVNDSKDRDHPDEVPADESKIELPPTPQNTQDFPDSQTTEVKETPLEKEAQQTIKSSPVELQPEEPSSREENQQTIESEFIKVRPEIVHEDTATTKKLSVPSLSEETRRRRSSRLSEKMPLLGKSPSKIVSHYFTPRNSIQQQQHEQPDEHEIPSAPPHQPLSPQVKSRDNVVVLIPPPAERRSSIDMQKTSTSVIRGFTTPHSYYPPISSLPTHFDDQIDVLAVAVITSEQPKRAKDGPRDYYLSLKLADSSCNTDDMICIQLFRPYKNALPTCDRGDVLLLRGMKVQTRPTPGTRSKSQPNKDLDGLLLLSTESSAWAIFKFPPADQISASEARPGSRDGSARLPAKRGTPTKMNVQINGPPVEFGAEERAFAKGLNKWWVEEGEAMFPDTKNKPGRKSIGKESQKTDEVEHLHEHELRDGMAYGDIITPRPMHEHFHLDEQVHRGDVDGGLHEHELRDGMVYGDTISPKPMHEHHHDHDHDLDHHHNPEHSQTQNRDPTRPEAKETEEEVVESMFHEHELRDGMAYGDATNPRPLHEHRHLEGTSSHKGVFDDHYHHDDQATADKSPAEHKTTHSHNLRKSVSNTNAAEAPASLTATPKSKSRTTRRRRRGSST